MKNTLRAALALALFAAPTASVWAQNLNPGHEGGSAAEIGVPTYGSDQPYDPALTTGSRLSVKANTPADMNPTVPGATGLTIVRGDNSTISGDRRATVEQKTDGTLSIGG